MTESSIPQTIESCGFCCAEDVRELQVMEAGMTNRSYSFYIQDKRYIIRIPGEGTEQLINRAREHEVYRVVSPLGISEHVHYLTRIRHQKSRPIWKTHTPVTAAAKITFRSA